jgi:hypothetical protein
MDKYKYVFECLNFRVINIDVQHKGVSIDNITTVYNTTLKQSDSKWIFIKVKHEKDHSKVATIHFHLCS